MRVCALLLSRCTFCSVRIYRSAKCRTGSLACRIEQPACRNYTAPTNRRYYPQ